MKPRVIICLLLRDGVLYRTKQFRPDYLYTANFVGTLEADEVVMVDIGTDRQAFYRAAEKYAKRCFSPLTLGGHVDSVDEAERLLELGADKVLVNSWRGVHGLNERIAGRWGRQVLVNGIDKWTGDSKSNCRQMAKWCVDDGAGEILLTSVERDGSLDGYDIPTLQAVVSEVDVPVLVAGGCGGWRHMLEAFQAGAAGAVTANIHHFPDGAIRGFKDNLRAAGIEVRT